MNARVLRLLDRYLGTLLYLAAALALRTFVFVAGPREHEQNNRVLAIRLWALGETVLAMPSMKALRDRGYHVTALATPYNKDVLAGSGACDDIVVMDFHPLRMLRTVRRLRRRRFAVAVDYEPYTRFSAVLALASGAPVRIGFSNRPLLYTRVVVPREEEHAVVNFMNLARCLVRARNPARLVALAADAHVPFRGMRKPVIAVHAGSGGSSPERRWPAERFAHVCLSLSRTYEIVLVGNEADVNAAIRRRVPGARDASNALTVRELAAFMRRCSAFIGNDSGLMHIAAAMGVPVVGLFGPNTPARYGPYGPRCIGLYKGPGTPFILPFRGIFPDRFPEDYVSRISEQDVLVALRKLRSRTGGRIRR